MQCPLCGSSKTYKHGKVGRRKQQQFFCPACQKAFISNMLSGRRIAIIVGLAASSTMMAVMYFFLSGNLVVYGVPSSVIIQFLADETARAAYLNGHNQVLHDRLNEMGIEEQMKDFYRSHISDETLLDQHIHQILYDCTGYVGDAYRLNADGHLVLRSEVP